MAEDEDRDLENDALFAEAAAAVKETEATGYLGDPIMVESLLREAVADVMGQFGVMSPPQRVAAVRDKSMELGLVLLGASKNYRAMQRWNVPGGIDEFCAKWIGLSDADPAARMAHAVMSMFDEMADLAVYASKSGVMTEQWRWQIDAIIEKYTLLFVGVDLPSQALM